MYWLMVKTHNKTGLKYLCQTRREDPFSYPGSGKYWRLHLDEHGYDYSTEILGQYPTQEELKEAGVRYSTLHSVVESEEWANLREESGDGGDTSKTDGYKEGMKKRRSYSGKSNPNYGKVGSWSGKVGPNVGLKWYNDGKEELLCGEKPSGWIEGRLKVTCAHCGKETNLTNHTRWHGDNCNRNETRKKQSQALIGKVWWTNGKDTKKSVHAPGIGWVRGRNRNSLWAIYKA